MSADLPLFGGSVAVLGAGDDEPWPWDADPLLEAAAGDEPGDPDVGLDDGPGITLFPPQRKAVDAARAAIEAGRRSGLVVMPTGVGKTITFGFLSKWAIEEKSWRVLILANRTTLLHQARTKLARVGVDTDLEQGENRARRDSLFACPCVVASMQTLQDRPNSRRNRLTEWPRDSFDLVVVDEAHRIGSKSYDKILNHFDYKYLIGFTATPDAIPDYFEEVLYDYPIWDAIGDGYLARPLVESIRTPIDVSGLRKLAGDLQDGALEDAMQPYMDYLANAIADRVAGKKGIVFTPGTKTAELLASALNDLAAQGVEGIRARSVRGESVDRDELLGEPDPDNPGQVRPGLFARGEVLQLCSSDLLIEGFDEPTIEFVALLRPTVRRSIIAQQIGRGTRRFLPDGTLKDNFLVLDFECLTGKHDLAHAADIFARPEDSAEARKIARDLIRDGVEPDPLKAAERARKEAERRERDRERRARRKQLEDEERERQKRLQEARKPKVKARRRQVQYTVQRYDPAGAANVLGVSTWTPPLLAGIYATEGQVRALERFGVERPETLTRRAASRMLDVLHRRAEKGLATLKQLNHLRKYLPKAEAEAMSRDEARRFLDLKWGKR